MIMVGMIDIRKSSVSGGWLAMKREWNMTLASTARTKGIFLTDDAGCGKQGHKAFILSTERS